MVETMDLNKPILVGVVHIMKKVSCVVFVLFIVFPSVTESGDFLVYDADGQLLGIQSDGAIYVPNLGGFMNFSTDGLPLNIGIGAYYDETEYFVLGDCTGTAYFQLKSNVSLLLPFISMDLDSEGERQYYRMSPLELITVGSFRNVESGACLSIDPPQQIRASRRIEVLENEFPFSLPIALPRIYVYENTKGDYDLDGDVDATDLKNFADDYGRAPR